MESYMISISAHQPACLTSYSSFRSFSVQDAPSLEDVAVRCNVAPRGDKSAVLFPKRRSGARLPPCEFIFADLLLPRGRESC